jgi:hypothetical protein
MSEHATELRTLARPADPVYGIEGKIWHPPASPTTEEI